MDNTKECRVLVRAQAQISFNCVVTVTDDAEAPLTTALKVARERAQALVRHLAVHEAEAAMSEAFEAPPGQDGITLTCETDGRPLGRLDQPWVQLDMIADPSMKGSATVVIFTEASGGSLSPVDIGVLQARIERMAWSPDAPPPRVMRHWEIAGSSVCFLLDRAVPLDLAPERRTKLCEMARSRR